MRFSGNLSDRGGVFFTPQCTQGRCKNGGGVKPSGLVHLLRRVLIYESIREHHRAQLEAFVEKASMSNELQDLRRESSDGALFYCDHNFVLAREPCNKVAIQRLGEARIGDGRG